MPVDAEALKKFADEELVKLNTQRDEANESFRNALTLCAACLNGAHMDCESPIIDRSMNPIDFCCCGHDITPEETFSLVKARGGLPYMPKLRVGENLIVLEAELPKDTEDQNKNLRKQFVARQMGNKERYAWNVNPRSPMYRELLTSLTVAPCVLRIIRVGEGQTDTRYDVKFERRIAPGE